MLLRKQRSVEASLLPGYTHVSEIGGGAFATVYRAVEEDTGRTVALKILKVDTIHPHLLDTFHREMQALAKVSDHPNIVTLYRPLATPDGRPVLVLELCRESFAQTVRRSGPLPPDEVVRVGIKIAGALETAHRNGFLHRDMKPQNILVTQFGEPALADFGVAALQASAQATAGVFGFTTLHAAPEMLEGQQLSAATDVYGLASTMYQLLTGLAPFAAFDNEAPASVILRIIRDPVRPVRSEHVPIGLSDLLEAALAKEPSGRPRTAAGFAEQLTAVESACGWPATTYVTWGEPLGTPAAEEAPVGAGADGAAGVAAKEQRLYGSAPSVQVAEVAHSRPGFEDGPAPVTARRDADRPFTPAPPPPPPAPLDEEPAPPPAATVTAPPPPAAPLPMSAPPPRVAQEAAVVSAIPGPSLSAPPPGDRAVVAPAVAPAPAVEAPARRPPVEPPPGLPRVPPAPEFVDPEPTHYAAAPAAVSESIYEQTRLPTAGTLTGRNRAQLPAPSRPAAASRRHLGPWQVASLGVAAAVVLVAVLLIVGVL